MFPWKKPFKLPDNSENLHLKNIIQITKWSTQKLENALLGLQF